jgi:hypothetical protein
MVLVPRPRLAVRLHLISRYPRGVFIPPAGYALSSYTPPNVAAVPPPPIILADQIRALDPNNPERGYDIADLLEGDDPTDAALQWQFTVRQGSGAALGENGNRLHLIRKATAGAPIQIADEGRRVVQKFQARGDIENVTVTGEVQGDSTAIAALEVRCRNVHTGRPWPLGSE